MKRSHTDEKLAKSAFEVLNDLMGEVHAGRIVGYLAVKNPDIFQTKHPQYLVRLGIGAIMIALYKFEDLWNHQLLHLLKDRVPPRGTQLIADLHDKKVREFRSLFVAHYSDRREFPKPSLGKLQSLLEAQGFHTDEELFLWTQDVVKVLGEVRDTLHVKFNL